MRRAAILSAAALGVALALRPVPAGAFMETWVVSLQRLVSGLKVSGNQSGTRAQQITTGFNASSMAAASVITSQDNALRIARATHTYGATTGTGYSACAVSLGLQDERDAYASAERTRRTFQRADATWLTSGGNAKDRLTDSLQQRREFYCTPAERETGWCRGSASGGYGAGDSDAAPWLLKRNYGAEEVMMAADYLDVVAPLPTIKPNPTTAEEDLDLIRARRQGAFMTGARTTILGVVIGGNLSAQRAITLEMLLSATKVHTAQIATNGLRETNLANGTQQAVAATLAQIGQREALVAVKEQYSIETGQGVNACTSINLMVNTNEALGNVAKNAREEYRELDVAPGKATPVGEAVRKRLANASRTDSAVLLDPAGSDSDRQAVIEAMTGLPMPVADRTMSGSEADLTMLRTRRVEALRSPALVSLSAVRAMSATEGHQTASDAVAPLRQLDALVEQYGGGPRFEAWSAALAGQSERGLLVELSRLRSMSLTLRQALIEQQARTTAVFGTMLAVQAGGQL